ncbi:MAG TPA: carboxypeptidase-like regulatory domain-containing protein, partial [Anaerolineae bacterium]|nr:carboxypeptidase-like regulatory domain-containing protein [Anaerolineae bacterium]
PPTPITPPGLLECRELLEVRGFEGNPTTVFNVWHAGGIGAFSRTSEQYFRGTFSMRLHASLGVYPCAQNPLQPYLYQDVQLPTEVYSITTLSVGGRYRVDASNLECSISGPDEDDVLYLRLLETDGDPITPLTMTHVITNGAAVTGTWHLINRDLSDDVNLEDYQGQPIRIYWNATHDSDYHGTFFYLDELSAQICTQWPVPDLEPGTGSIGGLIRTLNQYYVPVVLPGAEVWAYQQGGQTYETRSIQNGTYHFYNLPPGTYTIHSQTWVGSTLRTATTQVTIGADEVNFNVNLLLQ